MRKVVTIQLEGELPQPQSAYDLAVESGYEGSEEQYAKELATIPPTQEQFNAIPGRLSKITSTTEKSDFHHITDSASDKVLDFGMEGKTEQETTEGKNLWNAEYAKNKDNWDTTLIQGGFLTISIYVGVGTTVVASLKNNLEAGISFILGFSVKLPYSGTMIYDKTDTESICLTSTDGYVYICVNSNGYDNFITYANDILQVEINSTATDYEPYTNGPSPNPDFPQEIVNAGVMKNLWSYGDISGTTSVIDELEPIPAGTYTISADVKSSDTDSTSCMLYFYYSNGGGIGTTLLNGKRDSGKLTFTDEVYRFIAYASNNSANSADDTFSFTDIQLELGSVATDYEPYGQYKIGCRVVNKNLWDAEYARDMTNWSEGYGTTYPAIPVKVIPSKPVTIHYPAFLETGISMFATIVNPIKDGTYSNEWMYHKTATTLIKNSITFTPIKDVIYVTVASVHVDQSSLNTFMENIGNDLQIEIADAPTDHTPHASQQLTLTSPVPLTKWDYLTKRDGVYGWSIWSDSGIFDGSSDELWTRLNSSNDIRSIIRTNSVTNKVAGKENALCSHFWQYHSKYPTNYHLWLQPELYNACSGTNSAGQVYFNVSPIFTTVDEWRAWLAENPIAIVWETSSEQSFHPLPDEEQTLLNNLETYYGVTNLYNDQGCPMWLTYVQDTKTAVDNKFNNIKTALLSLGANV